MPPRHFTIDSIRTLQISEEAFPNLEESEKKWRVKLRRVRAISMTIQSSVKDKILATPSETSKVENALAKMLRDLDQQMEKREDDETTDKVVLIKDKFKAARDRQKSYADNSRKPLEFEVGNHELLKILERVGHVAYRLRLPEELSGVHDTFHVSNLKKCLADASLHVPLDEIKVDKTLCLLRETVKDIDREVRVKTVAEWR
ncbi:hypothetical protein Tco_1035352 [Tanacetum coccineum]